MDVCRRQGRQRSLAPQIKEKETIFRATPAIYAEWKPAFSQKNFKRNKTVEKICL